MSEETPGIDEPQAVCEIKALHVFALELHSFALTTYHCMNISFPHDKPGIYSLNKSVAFPAVVNGKNTTCEISEEALEQHFEGRPPPNYTKAEYDATMVAAFEAARDRIEAVALKRLEENPEGACYLRPDDF